MTSARLDSADTGGGLCSSVCHRVKKEPVSAGYCCCSISRKASGSGFVPFLDLPATQFELTGATKPFLSARRGSSARRNFCPGCGSLVHGGELGVDGNFTIHAGTVDPGWFRPSIAICTKDLPTWVMLPNHIRRFDAMPEP